MSSNRYAAIATAGVLCLGGLIALAWGTPDFAVTLPAGDSLREVGDDEVFRVSWSQIELEDPVGFRCFFETRPAHPNAFSPPVTVLWLTNGEDSIRFSSKGCSGGEVRINDEVRRGGEIIVLDDCSFEIDGEGAPGALMELILDQQESRIGPYAEPAPTNTSIIFHNLCSVVVDDEAAGGLWLIREDLESHPHRGVTSITFDQAGTQVLVTDAGCESGQLLVKGQLVLNKSFRVLGSMEVVPIGTDEAVHRSMQRAPR